MLKGFIPTLVAYFAFKNVAGCSSEIAVYVSGFSVVLGHIFPVLFNFKGGKGIATSLGVLLTLEWEIGLICLIFALVLMLSSRMVSLGSIFSAFLYPVLVAVIGNEYGTDLKHKLPYFIFACCIALLAIVRHRKNITRLLNGTENKLWKTKKENPLIFKGFSKNCQNYSALFSTATGTSFTIAVSAPSPRRGPILNT